MLMLLHILIVVFKGKEKLMIILSYELELLKHMASEETCVVINRWTKFFKKSFWNLLISFIKQNNTSLLNFYALRVSLMQKIAINNS